MLSAADIKALLLFKKTNVLSAKYGRENKSLSIQYFINHENEINALIKLTRDTIPSHPNDVIITYTKQNQTYHVYNNHIECDLIYLCNQLAEYFYCGEFSWDENKQKAKSMEKKKQLFVTELQAVCNHYRLDMDSYKESLAKWYQNHDCARTIPTRFIINLPITYKSTLPT